MKRFFILGGLFLCFFTTPVRAEGLSDEELITKKYDDGANFVEFRENETSGVLQVNAIVEENCMPDCIEVVFTNATTQEIMPVFLRPENNYEYITRLPSGTYYVSAESEDCYVSVPNLKYVMTPDFETHVTVAAGSKEFIAQSEIALFATNKKNTVVTSDAVTLEEVESLIDEEDEMKYKQFMEDREEKSQPSEVSFEAVKTESNKKPDLWKTGLGIGFLVCFGILIAWCKKRKKG